jgi:hypothetical protein
MVNRIRELGEFPFSKLKPVDFRLKIAGLPDRELQMRKIKVWVETSDIVKVVKLVGFGRVIRAYPHLDYVYLETYANELASLVESELVRSVWNDVPVKAEASLGFIYADRGAATVAARAQRRAR